MNRGQRGVRVSLRAPAIAPGALIRCPAERGVLDHALLLAVAAVLVAGCGGPENTEAARAAARDTISRAPAAPSIGPAVEDATSQMIARGDSIFHGTGGGICYTCHGMKGVGTQLGPSLADAEWLHGDGGQEFLVRTITTGVPTPRQYPAMMPPFGGTPLTTEQVQAVAAYVHSLSHPRTG